MIRRRWAWVAILAVAAGVALGGAANAAAETLTGAGSTLIEPLLSDWSAGWLAATGNSVSYSAAGSLAGINAVSSRSVDFGASDAPLSQPQATSCNGCVMIPWAVSATAVGFHLSGVSVLKLTGKVLAEIYLGQIKNWSNSQIKALNPGQHLPNRKITVIFRKDGSGDTYAFTQYLAAVSGAWSSRVGHGTSVSFPTGVAGTGNGGVTALLSNINGGIAYVAASYLLQFGLGAAAIQNAAGKFEYPNLANIKSAADSVTAIPPNNAISIVNPPKSAKIAYPISTFTYAIVPQNTSKPLLLQSLISYALTTGQAFGAKLDFPPIPQIVLRRAETALGSLT
jgi:phosphate transport system substrate-binding protein